MKKQVFCGVFALALAVTGCGVQKKEAASDIVPENRQELTILHVDAGTEGFDSFISQAEKDLGIKIHIEKMSGQCGQSPGQNSNSSDIRR
ncbi:hypothetical protein [Ruminococcus sp. SR1/5]|uniref:hypothetical protein n=1 Tax=Ruminococcus sp. SR1/5 TaxID=657323 RepID=UPI0002ED9368|nr:hypothetical protein [Ruminococcus sp. SR1/5]